MCGQLPEVHRKQQLRFLFVICDNLRLNHDNDESYSQGTFSYFPEYIVGYNFNATLLMSIWLPHLRFISRFPSAII